MSGIFSNPSSTGIDGQIVAFDSYIQTPKKTSNFAPCLCGSEGGFLENTIRLGRQDFNVPLQWSKDGFTATQIVEGKISKKVMRSQKLVLCQVEDDRRRWFEVSGLMSDLSYPFDASLLGIRVFAFDAYKEAKAQFNSLINSTK